MKLFKQIALLVLVFGLVQVLFTVGIHTALRNNALGFDYMLNYNAGQALFTEGVSPYSSEVVLRNQMQVFGRPAKPGEYDFPFTYPLPILLIPLPLFFLSYDWSQAAWMAFNILVPITLSALLFPTKPKWLTLSLPFFYTVSFTVIIGNYALLMTFIFLAAFYLLFRAEKPPAWADFIAGVGLAWVTNKPQLVWLMLIFLLLLALRGKRWWLFGGLAFGFLAMHLWAFALVPDWFMQWLGVIDSYPSNPAHVPLIVSYLNTFLPIATARVAALILAIPLAAVTAWLFARWWKGRMSNILLLAWCALMTSFADPSAMTPDQNMLLIVVFLWAIEQRPTRWLKTGWFAALVLTYVSFALNLTGLISGATERGPQLMYLAWLVWLWIKEQRTVARSMLVEAG